MPILDDRSSLRSRLGGASNAALRLLAAQLGAGGVVLLASKRGSAEIEVEDAVPAAGLLGGKLRIPPGLLSDDMVMLDTSDVRLALGWTEGCGGRPRYLLAAPVMDASLFLIVASCVADTLDVTSVSAAVEILHSAFNLGQMTRRERDMSLRINALIDNLPAPVVFVDSRDLQVFLNDEARHLLEIDGSGPQRIMVAEALARSIRNSPDKDLQSRLTAEPQANLHFETAMRDRHYMVETRWIDHDTLTGRIWLFNDVTAEKAFRSRLADLTRLLQLTVENVSEGVLLVDDDLRLILWNETFIELFDLPRANFHEGADFVPLLQIMARRGELRSGDPDAIVAGAVASIRAQESRLDEITRNDGRILDVLRKSLAGGRFILAVRDVTEERQIARLKDELVSTVSHELRTPLTSISGSLALLKGGLAGPLPELAENLIEVAHRNSDRLARLVNDLLDMDKLGSGNLEFHFANVDLNQLLRETVEQNLPYARKFDVTLALELPDLPVVAKIDPDRIGQVMSNLISNAAKFSPGGSTVRIVLIEDGDHIRICVIDRGRGIAPEFRARLFTRFAQEDRSTDHGQAGTGLGLAISKAIIDHHGGTIDVDPEVTVGTTFRIDLPAAREGAA